MASKILVTGDVNGRFDSLFARVGKVHTLKGPFHALLCVGSSFLGREGTKALRDYVDGKKQVPLPTYFIAGDEFDTSLIDSLSSGGQVCPNLHYLGRAGVSALELGGVTLKFAFLSGVYDQSSYFNTMAATGGARMTKYQPHYIEEDVVSVLAAGVQQDVDILLTAEWGRGWAALMPPEKVPEGLRGPGAHGSPVVAKLASQLSARYHFAGTLDSYLELTPYRSRAFVTRFFGLAMHESPKKEKSLYACNVAPFASIDRAAIPPETTPCPYTVGSKPSPAAAAAAAAASSTGMATAVAYPASAAPASHPFPSDTGSNKRQKLDATNAFPDPRAAAVAAGDAISLATTRWNFEKPQRGPPPPHYVCRICQEPGHWLEQCPQKAARTDHDVPPADYVCRKCNEPGHYIRTCPLIAAENASGVRAPRPPPADYSCAKCKMPAGSPSSHWIKDCPLIAAERSAGSVPPGYVCKVCREPGHLITDCPIVKQEQVERAAARNGPPPAGYICNRCGVKDAHFSDRCPTNPSGPRLSFPRRQPAAGGLDDKGNPIGTKDDCWFCLATEHVSTHLILSVGNENYLALAKGALNDEHVLILPIVHVATSLDLTADQAKEMDRYKLALRQYYRAKGLECIMYERFIPTRAAQHMHIQIVPVTKEQARLAKGVILEQAKLLNDQCVFQEIPKTNTLLQANPGKQPFIVFEMPTFYEQDDQQMADASVGSQATASDFPLTRLIHYVNGRAKIFGLFDFPRNACAAVIGRPEKGDWRKCTTSEAEETEVVEKMKATFAPFDFTLQEEAAEATPAEPAPAAAAADEKMQTEPATV